MTDHRNIIAVAYQDGSFMTMATRFTEKKQIEEARHLVKEANDGCKPQHATARIVRVDIMVRESL